MSSSPRQSVREILLVALEGDRDETAARLQWVEAIRQVLENALALLGVFAPDTMKRLGDEDAES